MMPASALAMIPALLALLGQTAGAYDCQGQGEFHSFAEMYHGFLDEIGEVSLREYVQQRGKFMELQAAHAHARALLDEAAEPIKEQLDDTCKERYRELERHHHASQRELDDTVMEVLAKAERSCIRIRGIGESFEAVFKLQVLHTHAAHKLDSLDLGRQCQVELEPGFEYEVLSKQHDCARHDLDESIAKLFAMLTKTC